MNNLERFKENLTALLGEENFEQFQDFFRVKSVGRDLSLALTTLGLVFVCLTGFISMVGFKLYFYGFFKVWIKEFRLYD